MTTDNLADIYPASPLTQWYDKEAPVCADLLHATSIIGKKQTSCLFTCTTHGEGSSRTYVGISVLFVDTVDTVVTAHFKQLTATPRGNTTATYRTTNKELHKEQEKTLASAKDNILMSGSQQ